MKILVYSGIAAAAIVIAVALAISSQAESDQNRVRVAFFANVGHAIPIVGLENGYFEQELGHTKIQTMVMDSGPQAIEALFANSLDLAYVGPGPFVNGYVKSKGADLRILEGAASGGASFVIQKDSTIKSAADLAGKKIAAPQIGNTQDVSLRHYLSENSLKTAEKGGNVIVYNIANPETYTLFAKGDIDAAWVPEPLASVLVNELGGIRLFNEEETWPDKQFSSVLLIGRTEYLQKHPEIIDKWVLAHEKTAAWIKQNPEQTEIVFNQFHKKYTGRELPAHIVHDAFSNLVITTDPPENSIRVFAERAYSLGYLGHSGYTLENIRYGEADLVADVG
jgi:NitT/TauT family transport system substrate-binding protein